MAGGARYLLAKAGWAIAALFGMRHCTSLEEAMVVLTLRTRRLDKWRRTANSPSGFNPTGRLMFPDRITAPLSMTEAERRSCTLSAGLAMWLIVRFTLTQLNMHP